MRTLFVGLSGPIGYDYQGEHGSHSANAVLEDVTGLLLCYDELVFLSRELCPSDMKGLEYVRFLEDDEQSLARALVAVEQFMEIREDAQLGMFEWRGWQDVVRHVTGSDPACRVDNHSRPLRALPNERPLAGNAAEVGNALLDVGVAVSLQLDQIDVLTNSVASRAVNLAISELDPTPRHMYTDWQVDIAQELGSIRVPNVWNSRGGYDPAVEDLRHHHEVEAFRAFLSKEVQDGAEASERAAEITSLADVYARQELSRRHEPKSIYRTVGRALLGPVLNYVQPGLGTVGSSGLKALDWVAERKRDSETAWAAFVVDTLQEKSD
jgi:hypothetical protein